MQERRVGMVIIQNHIGEIKLSRQFFSQLIGNTLVNCFGVVDTNAGNVRQIMINTLPFLKKRLQTDKGVNIRPTQDGKLVIDLHITVMYGVNVGSVVKNIRHKIMYAVEEETGLAVQKINVFVDGIKS